MVFLDVDRFEQWKKNDCEFFGNKGNSQQTADKNTSDYKITESDIGRYGAQEGSNFTFDRKSLGSKSKKFFLDEKDYEKD